MNDVPKITQSTEPWELALPPQRRGQERFLAIVKAATAIIAEYGSGHDALSIKNISERSSTRTATIYHYFPSIDAIVSAVAVRYMREFESELDPVFLASYKSEKSFHDDVVETCRSFFARRPGLRELWFDRRLSGSVHRTDPDIR